PGSPLAFLQKEFEVSESQGRVLGVQACGVVEGRCSPGRDFRSPPSSSPRRPALLCGGAFLGLLVLRLLPDWAGLGGAMLVFGLVAVLGTPSRTRIGGNLAGRALRHGWIEVSACGGVTTRNTCAVTEL